MTMPQTNSSGPNRSLTPANFALRIQSTLISNAITEALWRTHIDDCLTYHFHAAMVPPAWIKSTAELLSGSSIRIASFIDLPLGTMTSAGKAYEAAHMVQLGVQEIDLMPNVGFLLSGMEREYYEDIAGVVSAATNVPIKVMLELPLLNQRQKEQAIQISIDAGVAYLKNASSGAVGVAQPSDIAFLRERAPAHIHIKASGGIKSADHVQRLLNSGADLVGTSAASAIMQELAISGTPDGPPGH